MWRKNKLWNQRGLSPLGLTASCDGREGGEGTTTSWQVFDGWADPAGLFMWSTNLLPPPHPNPWTFLLDYWGGEGGVLSDPLTPQAPTEQGFSVCVQNNSSNLIIPCTVHIS
jgi:hypothetical protein